MTTSGKALAVVGGGVVGTLLGAVVGALGADFMFRMPPPDASPNASEHYFISAGDLLERGVTTLANVMVLLSGAVVGGSVGCAGGIVFALRSMRTPPNQQAPHLPLKPP